MKLGLHLPTWSNDSSKLPVRRLVEYTQRAEEYGFESAWVIDHLTKPASYGRSWHDPFTTLSFLANATDRIQLGTGILVFPMRNPVLVAKQAATLHELAEGRLTLGLGLGYVKQDFAAVNVPFKERSPRFTEGLELLYQLLHNDRVTFSGEFFSVKDFELEPRLARPPKIIIGGSGTYRDEDQDHYGGGEIGDRFVPEAVLERIARADGWIATARSLDTTTFDFGAVTDHIEQSGTDPRQSELYAHQYVHLVPRANTTDAIDEQRAVFKNYIGERRPIEYAEENYLFGSIEDIREQISEYESLGFDQLMIGPVTDSPNELDRQLDLWNEHILSEFD